MLSTSLGTNTYLTDMEGQPYQLFINLPFGETMAEQTGTGYQSPYKFNGKELDAETGLYYYGARYYDPQSSTWLSVDPLAEKYAGWTPYNYCGGNPIIFKDPNGKEILIFYKDENGKEQNFTYGLNAPVPQNEFVRSTIGAINFMKDNGLASKINQLASDERNVEIRQGEQNYNKASAAFWNPNSGYLTKEGEQIEPVYGLANELGHQWYGLYLPGPTPSEIAVDGFKNNPWDHPKSGEKRGANFNPTADYGKWHGFEEYLVIMIWDNRLLINTGKPPRLHHFGSQFETNGT